MAEALDYYQVIGVSPSATGEEIKAAYRKAAKRAHPDAGGSVAAMQRVNEAYAALSKPAARSSYDRATREKASSPHGYEPRSATPAYTTMYTSPVHSAPVHPSQAALARNLAWRQVGYSSAAAILLGAIIPFLFDRTPDVASKIILAVTAFVPIYTLAVGIVFLFKPRLRIALAHLGVPRLPPLSDLLALFGVAVAAIPLLAVWVIGFFIGVIR